MRRKDRKLQVKVAKLVRGYQWDCGHYYKDSIEIADRILKLVEEEIELVANNVKFH